jgi:DHA2 family multidrug resistance protein
VGVAALQIMLDKGQEDDWFGSRFITTLAVTAAVCLVSLVIWEWRHKAPILDVHLFKNFNFAASNLMMFILGVLYFASLVMMPQLLQTLMGYTATLAGLVLSGSGFVLLLEMPLVGQLTSKYPAKYIMAFGWLCMAGSMYFSAIRIDLLISFGYASWLRILQAFALGFLFVPITLSAYVGLPAEKSNAIAGMINFMRNIGSSVGTSLVTTLLARRAQFHQTVLGVHANTYSPAFRNQLNALAAQLVHSGTSVADAQRKAQALLYQSLGAQAQTLAYIDTFKVLAIGAAVMFVLTFLLKKNDPRAGGAEAAVG